MAGVARTDTASRVIAASPERVYAALIDPDAFATWLPPAGMTGRLDGTRVEIRADDVPSGISAEDHAEGLASSLANLAAYLER